jgi:hypothetical protein
MLPSTKTYFYLLYLQKSVRKLSEAYYLNASRTPISI